MIYRKRGHVIRHEHDHVVRSFECGEAFEDGAVFRSRPCPSPAAPLPALRGEGEEVVNAIQALVKPPLIIERMIVIEGYAQHECDDVCWSETTRRVHVAVAHTKRPLRVIVDLADFELDDVTRAVEALLRAGDERDTPAHIRLAANVGAAVLPSFVGTEVVDIWQTAAEHDGNGQRVLEQRVVAPPWPNVFRPSYRMRPVRMPLHLRAVARSNEIDRDAPLAVALTAPVAGNVLHALCVSEGAVFPASFAIERVEAVVATKRWYPYAAGSFGAEMMCTRITPDR